jgi:hypothetical protein
MSTADIAPSQMFVASRPSRWCFANQHLIGNRQLAIGNEKSPALNNAGLQYWLKFFGASCWTGRAV